MRPENACLRQLELYVPLVALKTRHVRERAKTALLLVDVVNDFDFPGSERLLPFALPAAHKLARLRRRARQHDIPCIYLNDNFGNWRSDFRAQVKRCAAARARGANITRLLKPAARDYFVLKPHRSAFYGTPLDLLLRELGARTLVIAGFAGNICVMHTAADAAMRGFRIYIPSDCCASEGEAENTHALAIMRKTLQADLTASDELDLQRL